MKHFYQNIPGWFDFEDIYLQAIGRAGDAAHFVEVGAWLGRSTAFMAVEIANSGKAIQFDVVDTWLGVPGGEEIYTVAHPYYEFSRNIIPVRESIKIWQTYSVSAAKHFEDNSLDFVFIDADHSYESVLSDLHAWHSKVKPGGILAGHDYPQEGVAAAVNEFFPADKIVAIGRSWLVYV